MSDPRINPPRPTTATTNTNTIYYIVGGLVVAVILGFWLMSGANEGVVTSTGDDNSVTIETPAVDPVPADPVDPAPADPVDPPVADPVDPAPADPVEPVPADPVDPPVVDPAAPATNP